MELFLQIAGVAIVLLVASRAAVEAVGAVGRRRLEAERQRSSLDAFCERARLELAVARQESARKQESWDGWRKFEVTRKVEEAQDIFSFYLEPHDHLPVATYLPGQHLRFRLRPLGVERPLVRCYSLSDGPGDHSCYRITVKRAMPESPEHPPGRASSYLIDEVEVGDLLDVGAPGGHFHLDPKSPRPLVLAGGGVGLTPLLAMLNYLDEQPWNRDVFLFYGVRNQLEHPMKERLEELRAKHDRLEIITAYSRPTPECRYGRDFNADGHVSRHLISHHLPSSDFEFYLCGPPAMMASLVPDLEAWGVPREDIHFEAFGPSSVRRQTVPGEESTPVEVVFGRSGCKVSWRGTGSLLDLAMENGVAMDSGCAAGSCGSCLTAIKEGEVRYLAEPADTPESGSCLPCVCVPDGPLVLDA